MMASLRKTIHIYQLRIIAAFIGVAIALAGCVKLVSSDTQPVIQDPYISLSVNDVLHLQAILWLNFYVPTQGLFSNKPERDRVKACGFEVKNEMKTTLFSIDPFSAMSRVDTTNNLAFGQRILDSLRDSSKYFVRSYVTIDTKTFYSRQDSFTAMK